MLGSGECAGLDEALGVRVLGTSRLDGIAGVEDGGAVIAVAGPGVEVLQVQARDGAKVVAGLWEMRRALTRVGEQALRRGAASADDRALGLPAAVVTDRSLYLSVSLFEHLGGAVQGHVDLEGLRARLRGIAGLEDGVLWLARLMDDALPEVPWRVRVPPWGCRPSALVLRHDTDHSRDTTYLDHEVRERVPATYAVLPDANRRHWLDALAPHAHVEAAFHYRTNVESRLGRLLHRGSGYVPDRRAVTGRGLARQAAAARRLGIPTGTLHRHASFFFYPESLVGLDALARAIPEVIGTSSIFRWTLYRYGDSPFAQALTVLHPDTSVPFWMPFTPVLPTRAGHRVLRTWESTHLIEPDDGVLAELFDHADTAPGGAYVVGYHPAHATAPTFTPAGNFGWFRRCVDEARRRDWWIVTCRDLYERLSAWERLALTTDEHGARVENRSTRPFADLVVATAAGRWHLGDVPAGGEARVSW
jgi:hypothetical protein